MTPTLQTVIDALQSVWSADTAYNSNDWSDDNKARGQCVVSSLIVQDYFGGELQRYSIDEGNLHETHYVNKFDNGVVVDTTASQYKQPVNMRIKPIHLDNFKSIREKLFTDESTQKRYEILKSRVERHLAATSS